MGYMKNNTTLCSKLLDVLAFSKYVAFAIYIDMYI
jgi:hypothetical protein